jgi:CubicO group peptidase (beta-lactamase class C family)
LIDNKLIGEPGKQFAYGSWTMQLGGIWAASRAGADWHRVHARILAEPLGLRDTFWGYMAPEGAPGEATNPNIQAGLWTSPRDLAEFASAIQSRKFLNKSAMASVERDLSRGLHRAFAPPGAEAEGFGLGIWCEASAADGTCPIVKSSGAWGTTHWVNRQSGVWGVFFVFDRGPRIQFDLGVLRDAAEALVLKHDRDGGWNSASEVSSAPGKVCWETDR